MEQHSAKDKVKGLKLNRSLKKGCESVVKEERGKKLDGGIFFEFGLLSGKGDEYRMMATQAQAL